MKYSLPSLLLAVSAVADDAVKALRAAAEKGEAKAWARASKQLGLKTLD